MRPIELHPIFQKQIYGNILLNVIKIQHECNNEVFHMEEKYQLYLQRVKWQNGCFKIINLPDSKNFGLINLWINSYRN